LYHTYVSFLYWLCDVIGCLTPIKLFICFAININVFIYNYILVRTQLYNLVKVFKLMHILCLCSEYLCTHATVTQANNIDWCNVVIIRLNHSEHMNSPRFCLIRFAIDAHSLPLQWIFMYPLLCSNSSKVWNYQRNNQERKSNKDRQWNGQNILSCMLLQPSRDYLHTICVLIWKY
jgi:hypothetical protein